MNYYWQSIAYYWLFYDLLLCEDIADINLLATFRKKLGEMNENIMRNEISVSNVLYIMTVFLINKDIK